VPTVGYYPELGAAWDSKNDVHKYSQTVFRIQSKLEFVSSWFLLYFLSLLYLRETAKMLY